MASIFVDSNAVGANNGTSWTDAFTSLGSSVAATGSDTVFVAHDHSETLSATTTWAWTSGFASNPVPIVSTNKATGLYQAGATISVTSSFNLSILNSLCVYGLTIRSAADLILVGNNSARQEWEDCTFAINSGAGSNRRITLNSSANAGAEIRFRRCNIDLDTNGGSASQLVCSMTGIVDFIDTPIKANSATDAIIMVQSRMAAIRLDGCDLSASPETTLVRWNGAQWASFHFQRCRLPVGYTRSTGTIGAGNRMLLERCASGTITDPPLGLTYLEHYLGAVDSTGSVYRTGGASDGHTPHSWRLIPISTVKTLNSPLAAPPLRRWVAGGSALTFRVYLASGTTLTDADCWITLSGPDDSSPASTEGYNATSRPAPLATPTNLPADATSVWVGSGVGTPQYIELPPYTPQVDGVVTVQFFSAKASTSVYVDPRLEVT